ncbi:MAG: hypothetical protein GY719_14000 [bacterium]|nr:hypothetical protein [bacterium]
MTEDSSSLERQRGRPRTVADVENAIGPLDEAGWRRLRTAVSAAEIFAPSSA